MTFARVIFRTFVILYLSLWCHIAVAITGDSNPAELPPEDFSANAYIDSRGCLYIRVMFDDALHWVPQVAKNRVSVCGLSPTFGNPVAEALGLDPAMPVPAPTLQDVAVSKKKTAVIPKSQTAAAPQVTLPTTEKPEIAKKPEIAEKPGTTEKLAIAQTPEITRKSEARQKPALAPKAAVKSQNMPLGYATAWQDQAIEPCGTKCVSGASAAALRFVQVATFAVKANAERTAAKLKALGLPVVIKRSKIKGRIYCVVLAGPFEKKPGLMTALKTTRKAGFKDAFTRR